MNTSSVTKFFKNVQLTMAKHSPEILTGIGIAGMIGTTILAVKATPKAIKLCEQVKHEKEEPTKLDYVKATWKCYIPTAVTGTTSIACLIGASSVNARRNAALATAYKLSETAFVEYKDKVVETLGEKKEQVIKDKIAKEKIEKDPVTSKEVIVTDKGTTLCYDGLFGRYFKSDMETIKRAENTLNRHIVSYEYASLNDFYRELGLGPVNIGNDLGWRLDDGQIEIDFSSQLADDGTPCLVIMYNVAPKYDYDKFF